MSAGSTVWRVHHVHHAGESFNPPAQPTTLRGGRFDSIDGSYAYIYVGDTPTTAIVETVLRDLPLGSQPQVLPRRGLQDRFLTELTVTRALRVLELHGSGLTHVGAPLSVTKCEADQYEVTRAWAHALRSWFPTVDGFRYRPRHDEDAYAWVLFDDGDSTVQPRARGSLACSGRQTHLLDPAFAVELLTVLHTFNATVDH